MQRFLVVLPWPEFYEHSYMPNRLQANAVVCFSISTYGH